LTLGIDVGSTTLKTVVLDTDGNILEKSYARHLSKAREMTLSHLKTLRPLLENRRLKVALTGSAGLGIAKRSGLAFVQEVFAAADAVKRRTDGADVVIELGGEDAKILFLSGSPEERMNGTCAGGTGAFIDQMATLMDISLDELDAMSLRAGKLYPIASRCGVFAKSDIQPLLNQGARKEDIAASVFQAVVEQTVTGLAQGRKIEGRVLFLGGPLSFFAGLRKRFVKTLDISAENAVFPELARYFVALGAACHAGAFKQEDAMTYGELLARLEGMAAAGELKCEPPLFSSEAEYGAFRQRHDSFGARYRDIAGYSGRAFLGIDAGSTTTKLVLIDEDANILYKHYTGNGGSPLPIVKRELERVFALCGDKIHITASAATGYGEELMLAAFGVDFGVVETVAHYTAARRFNPLVDFIIDIGGQDIKCFTVRDGAVGDVVLNEACSSGCGSFIETFAKSLGYPVAEFARLALFSKAPVDLGSRCTVFMNSSVKQAQKDGATVEDISAGLAISVVKNALYKVIRGNADELGANIVVQGGTFLNDAVLRAFERELGREAVRLNISELMGAYGAALYAMENAREASSLVTAEKLKSFVHTASAAVCGGCANKCSLTVNKFGGGRGYVSGNRCERGAGGVKAEQPPNLMRYKYEYIATYPLAGGFRARIGLPLALNMYENLPFWADFLRSLRCEAVLSDFSSRALYMKGQGTVPSDTVCYPAKLVHGHIESLIEKGVEVIFYPCMTYNVDEGISDNCYNCPVVAYYPELIRANTGERGVKLLTPHISFGDERLFVKKAYEIFAGVIPGLKPAEVRAAAKKAYRAHQTFREDVAAEGERALVWARENSAKVLVMASRPYHVDPEVNHGIDSLLGSLGFVVLTEDAVSHRLDKPGLNVLNQWTYHARMYNAARFTTQNPDMEMVQLISFGCGLDAVTSDEIRDILRENGKLYSMLKIDEINNLGAAKIRMRSLLAAMNEREAVHEFSRR
jgi:predicted CoA-substrate-specific enzyme activase